MSQLCPGYLLIQITEIRTDSLPDGWEARYTCSWNKANGINPLNGSDSLNNPDGDGYDVNMDGSLSLDEQLVNHLNII